MKQLKISILIQGWAEFFYVTFEEKKFKIESWPPFSWGDRILLRNIWKLGSAWLNANVKEQIKKHDKDLQEDQG